MGISLGRRKNNHRKLYFQVTHTGFQVPYSRLRRDNSCLNSFSYNIEMSIFFKMYGLSLVHVWIFVCKYYIVVTGWQRPGIVPPMVYLHLTGVKWDLSLHCFDMCSEDKDFFYWAAHSTAFTDCEHYPLPCASEVNALIHVCDTIPCLFLTSNLLSLVSVRQIFFRWLLMVITGHCFIICYKFIIISRHGCGYCKVIPTYLILIVIFSVILKAEISNIGSSFLHFID